IKRALNTMDAKSIAALCLRLARYKKDNKELLTYLLFEAEDEAAYIQSVKNELEEQIAAAKKPSYYLTKKALRKVLRYMDKCIRYSGNKETETELRLFFCQQLREREFPLYRSRVLGNIYAQQIKKIETAVSKLHEDLQFDYREELDNLKVG
ncbi:MAG: hypothetical protein AAFP19_26330, partial [Bacteroidota bacterium]